MPTVIEQLQSSGIRRLGSPARGFRYRTAAGKRPGAADLARIDQLRLPPAWVEVAVNPSAGGKVQAIGKDAAGRWQYRYHEAFVRRQQRKKYDKMVRFGQALPRLRRVIARGLARRRPDREKVLACVLRILSTCFMRPGSTEYANEHGSFGLATLRHQHVSVSGDTVRFDFMGKSGKRQQRELADARVARVVRRLLRVRGRRLFRFENEDGTWTKLRRRHLNEYIHEVMGEQFSAKDFRTWAGTLICACALARAGVAESQRVQKTRISAAIKETAAQLGNTPAVCRSSYVFPSILESFRQGRTIAGRFESAAEVVSCERAALHAAEEALLELIRAGEAAPAAKRVSRRPLVEQLERSLERARAARTPRGPASRSSRGTAKTQRAQTSRGRSAAERRSPGVEARRERPRRV